MNMFNRLPGSRRTPSGLEWVVLKKLPAMLLAGTLLPTCVVLLIQAGLMDLDAKDALQAKYAVAGLVLFHWISMLTVGILCVIVVIMKGHGYVADAYPLPDSDRPKNAGAALALPTARDRL